MPLCPFHPFISLIPENQKKRCPIKQNFITKSLMKPASPDGRDCFFSRRHNEKRERSLWLCSCVIIVCANARRISSPSKVGCIKRQMPSVGCFLSPNLLTPSSEGAHLSVDIYSFIYVVFTPHKQRLRLREANGWKLRSGFLVHSLSDI